MIIRECTLSEVEEALVALQEEYPEYFDYEVSVGRDLILASPFRILIPTLGYSVRTGTYCNYNEEDGYFDADFSITLIYELNEDDPEKYLYFEQDGISISLHNYCKSVEKEISSCNFVCQIELAD